MPMSSSGCNRAASRSALNHVISSVIRHGVSKGVAVSKITPSCWPSSNAATLFVAVVPASVTGAGFPLSSELLGADAQNWGFSGLSVTGRPKPPVAFWENQVCYALHTSR
jgi:hypothetical protein